MIPQWITRDFIRKHVNDYVFIYSDDRNRNSYIGQALEACGEPNAYPITTRFWNCYGHSTQSFFRDDLYDECCFLIDSDLGRIRQKLLSDRRHLVLFPNIGRGYAELLVRGPRILEYLERQLLELQKEHNATSNLPI